MLDVISGGRIISGFVRGIGDEYYSMGLNPTHSLERFREAHDLIIRMWTETGPFNFDGKHYRLRYANLWPRPLQKPHPEIWVPGFGSVETVDWCTHPDRKYAYMATFMPEDVLAKFFKFYREKARGYGYESTPYKLGHLVPIYVAESDQQAVDEAAGHVLWLYHKGLRHAPNFLVPPGYMSVPSMMRMLEFGDAYEWSKMDFDELNRRGYCIVGSAETVRRRLSQYAGEMDFGLLLALLHIGDMPHHRTVKNMELFASEVMPPLRKEFAHMH